MYYNLRCTYIFKQVKSKEECLEHTLRTPLCFSVLL